MASTLVQIRVDEDLKNEAASIYERLGLDLPTAIRVFLKKSVEESGIPFSLKISTEKRNRRHADAILKAANKEAKKNKIQNLSLDEINAEIRAHREGR